MQTALLLAIVLQAPSAKQIAAKCEAVYRSAKTVHVRVTTTVRGSKCSAEIFAQKPDKLRVYGTSMFGSKYDLVCNGFSRQMVSNGESTTMGSLEEGIASITGISANTGTHVPALFFGTKWGALFAVAPIRMSKTKLGSKSVYHLRQTAPIHREAWLDSRTYQLVRTKTSVQGYEFLLSYEGVAFNKPIAASVFARRK